uniref:Uncharacterized protein n=1 Tax=Romanomermis culicivorax TaxID=13658 RepID=A0A915KUP1_ROMCU
MIARRNREILFDLLESCRKKDEYDEKKHTKRKSLKNLITDPGNSSTLKRSCYKRALAQQLSRPLA